MIYDPWHPWQVRHNSLFVSRTTYFNHIKDGAGVLPQSVMDFDIDAKTGKVNRARGRAVFPHRSVRLRLTHACKYGKV